MTYPDLFIEWRGCQSYQVKVTSPELIWLGFLNQYYKKHKQNTNKTQTQKTLNIKKKTPISRGLFLDLLNQVFPCFHCFSKTTPSHYVDYAIYFFFVEVANGMLLNCHMCQFSCFGICGNKKHPNLEKRVFTYQKLVCEEFLI